MLLYVRYNPTMMLEGHSLDRVMDCLLENQKLICHQD